MWDRDSLVAKSQIFFEHALEVDRDDPRFGLWCAFGLEMLVRAAVASVSPTLLAESDREHKNLLHALGRGNPRVVPKSIGSADAVRLCEMLFPNFKNEHSTAATALINRRNAELHTGEAAFAGYSTEKWVSGFYGCVNALAEAIGEPLKRLLGDDEAGEAARVLAAAETEVTGRIRDKIARYRAVFHDKEEVERKQLADNAQKSAEGLSTRRHHKVVCPACGSWATVQGEAFGQGKVGHDQESSEIIVKEPMSPRSFVCSACSMRLEGHSELAAAGLGAQYTRTTRYSPEEYYELMRPEDYQEIERIARDRLGFYHPDDREYDNE